MYQNRLSTQLLALCSIIAVVTTPALADRQTLGVNGTKYQCSVGHTNTLVDKTGRTLKFKGVLRNVNRSIRELRGRIDHLKSFSTKSARKMRKELTNTLALKQAITDCRDQRGKFAPSVPNGAPTPEPSDQEPSTTPSPNPTTDFWIPVDVPSDSSHSNGNFIYVDNQMTGSLLTSGNCLGHYDPASRTCENGSLTAYAHPQQAADITNPGDTVLIRGGTYNPYSNRIGENYHALLEISRSGTADQWITFKNYNHETVIFNGVHGGVTFVVRIGWDNIGWNNPPNNVSNSPILGIVLDGLKITEAAWEGVFFISSGYLTIKNCEISYNSYGGHAQKGGIGSGGPDTHDILIENNRIYANGNGVRLHDNIPPEQAPLRVTVKDNFVFANSFSENLGNSSGIDIWFAKDATVVGNILWDNPDAAINGIGNIGGRYLRNALLNSWQNPGNNEGMKFAVRGGGLNVSAFNIAAFNGNTGYDSTAAVGDLYFNNTVYKNDGVGIFVDGYGPHVMSNNISYQNNGSDLVHPWDGNLRSNWDYFMSPASDYNFLGTVAPYNPLVVTSGGNIEPHALNGDPLLTSPDSVLHPRNDIHQVIQPEAMFPNAQRVNGFVTIESARADIASHFKLQDGSRARNAASTLTAIRQAALADLGNLLMSIGSTDANCNGSGTLKYACTEKSDFRFAQMLVVLQSIVNRLLADGHSGYADLAPRMNFAGETIPLAMDFDGKSVSLDTPLSMGAIQ